MDLQGCRGQPASPRATGGNLCPSTWSSSSSSSSCSTDLGICRVVSFTSHSSLCCWVAEPSLNQVATPTKVTSQKPPTTKTLPRKSNTNAPATNNSLTRPGKMLVELLREAPSLRARQRSSLTSPKLPDKANKPRLSPKQPSLLSPQRCNARLSQVCSRCNNALQ